MLTRIDLTLLLLRLQLAIVHADPELGAAVLAEPYQHPDEPHIFEYLDRLIVALEPKIAAAGERPRKQALLRQLLKRLREMRTLLLQEWRRPDT